MTKIRFETKTYTNNHGHAPKGRGSWGFQITEIDGHEGEGAVHWSPSMTLAEAKRWVRPLAKTEADGIIPNGDVLVTVLP